MRERCRCWRSLLRVQVQARARAKVVRPVRMDPTQREVTSGYPGRLARRPCLRWTETDTILPLICKLHVCKLLVYRPAVYKPPSWMPNGKRISLQTCGGPCLLGPPETC